MAKKPVRCFEGTARPHERFWGLRNADETGGDPELEFYGYISEFSWFDDDITPKIFKEDLYKLGGGGPITVRMNSAGGEVFAASVIRSIIVEYPGKVTVRIDGLAASAATIVALAGDLVRMQDSAYFMIHDPATIAWGTIDEFKRVLEMLKTVKDGIVGTYLNKTGMSAEKLAKMMTAETWMTAQEALEHGFVDEIISTKEKDNAAPAMPENVAIVNALQHYVNVPAELLAQAQGKPEPDVKVGAEKRPEAIAPEAARLRDEVQLLK